jgi:CheY-like chemotaxis protein
VPAPLADAAQVQTRSLRILVVEDNRDAAESLTMVLQLWGHEVQVAFDGIAALDMAQRDPPDAVLSDIGLPTMDGYVLARRMRQQATLARVVLIAVSGYGRDEDKQRAIDAGFHHHLAKPPDLRVLATLLGTIARTTATDDPSRGLRAPRAS